MSSSTTTAAVAGAVPTSRSSRSTRTVPAQSAPGVTAAAACTAASSSAPEVHLLRRATFGPSPDSLADVTARGRSAWLESQLAPSTIDDRVCDELVARFPMAAWSPETTVAKLSVGSWDGMFHLGRATLARQVWSRRQLLEVMVGFWSDHLHVTSPSSDVWYCRADYDRTVIRPHALGSFSDMLVASARHPAMLRYLDNASSTASAPNENYGRELLELHTVGVDGGYTERDVVDCARLFTGLSVDWATGARLYRRRNHHTGAVRILGWSTAAHSSSAGEQLQQDFLRWLAVQPATARSLARKLAVRFVSDDPPAALVDALAATYVKNGTQIAPVLRQLFSSSAFAAGAGLKTKRPLEDLVSTLRVLGIGCGAGTQAVEQLYWMVQGRGHAPFAWGPPNGYPDVAPAWASTAGSVGAWNHHAELLNGWWPRGLVTPAAAALLPAQRPGTVGQLVDALAQRLLQQPLSAVERDALVAFTGRPSGSPLTAQDDLLGWRLGSLATLVLNTPTYASR